MHQPQLSAKSVTPRMDLIVRRDRFAARIVTLIDRIGNRIVRLTAADWQRLQHPESVDINEDLLWQQSKQAGLLTTRSGTASGDQLWRKLNPLRWLAIRVPLVSVDGLAHRLALQTDWLFSPLAILCGVTLYLIMLLSVAVGWNQAALSLRELIQHQQSLAGLGVSSLLLFVLIKLIHELAHAIACRRSGAAVGYLGFIFFLGMPSPYCDVSAVAANDSRWSRAAVMAAGVYMEMLLAVLATVIWWLTMFHHQAWVHLVCFQVMMISGMSTLLFNLNPLMKLDGYFVLSDILNVPNLRQLGAWSARNIAQIGLWSTIKSPTRLRTVGLALYHLFSMGYRLSILVAIAWFLLSLFIEWHLGWLGFGLGLLAAAIAIVGYFKQAVSVLCGEGSWAPVRLRRRLTWALGLPLLILLLAMWPLRREIEIVGIVDVAEAKTIYVYEAGIVQEVCHQYGDAVQSGEPLVRLRNDDLRLQTAALSNQNSLAEMESAFLSRRELQKDQNAVSWELDDAKRKLLETQLVSLKQRTEQLEICSPVSGIVLPPPLNDRMQSSLPTEQSIAGHDGTLRLDHLVGTALPRQAIWCRVGDPTRAAVYCRLTPSQRQLLQVGSPVQAMLDTGTIESIQGKIESIEEPLQSEDGLMQEAAFIARCDFSQMLASTERGTSPTWRLGCQVHCFLLVEQERVWQRILRSLRELMTVPLATS